MSMVAGFDTSGYRVMHSFMHHCKQAEQFERTRIFKNAPNLKATCTEMHAECPGVIYVHSKQTKVVCNCGCHPK